MFPISVFAEGFFVNGKNICGRKRSVVYRINNYDRFIYRVFIASIDRQWKGHRHLTMSNANRLTDVTYTLINSAWIRTNCALERQPRLCLYRARPVLSDTRVSWLRSRCPAWYTYIRTGNDRRARILPGAPTHAAIATTNRNWNQIIDLLRLYRTIFREQLGTEGP